MAQQCTVTAGQANGEYGQTYWTTFVVSYQLEFNIISVKEADVIQHGAGFPLQLLEDKDSLSIFPLSRVSRVSRFLGFPRFLGSGFKVFVVS